MTSKNQSQNSKSAQPKQDFVLTNISGVSCVNKDALAANPSNGNIAFTAASMLVLQDPRHSHQDYLNNPSGRRIKAVNFSDDGKYLAYGEAGYSPSVVVYNVAEGKQVSKFQMSHRCTVRAIEFHPRSIYLAVMCLNDFTIAVFDLKGKKLARMTFVVEPQGMTLPRVGSYLIVCGHRKVSLFSLMDIGSNVKSNIVFDRRSVLLGHQSDYTFVDVTSGAGQHIKKVYTVTSCGYLCDLNVGDILIDRASKIDSKCFCVKYSLGYAFVGCAKNTVKICNPANLSVVSIILDKDLFGASQFQPNMFKFESDAVAIAVNSSARIVTCVFSDHHKNSWSFKSDKNSIECKPIIPIDSNGNEVVPQPTSYEIQEKVSKVLSKVAAAKNMPPSAEDSTRKDKRLLDAPKNLPSRLKPFMPSFYVNATRFTPDGKEIICGNAEGEIKIFEAETGRLSRVIEAHTAAVTHIELLYNEHFRLMSSGGRDRVIFILDANKNYGLIQVLRDHSSAIASISMAHHDDVLTLVSSAADGVILIRRAIKGKQPRFVIVGGIADIVGKPKICAYGTDCIITGGVDGYLKFFQTEPYVSTKPTRTIKGVTRGKNFMKAVAIDPSGTFLVANSCTETFVFNVHTGKIIATISKIPGVSLISFTGDCKFLVCESNDGCRFFWRLPDRMSDVMKEKIGKGLCQPGTIKYETILSCISLCQDSPSGYVSAVNVIRSDSVEHGRKGESPTFLDEVLNDDEDEQLIAFVSAQKTPDCYESYSTCSSFSRSCTNITDAPLKNDVFQLSDQSDVCCNIFREARRLLRNTGASYSPPMDIIDDKNLYFAASSESSESKRTTVTRVDAHTDYITTDSVCTSRDLSTRQELSMTQEKYSKSFGRQADIVSLAKLKAEDANLIGQPQVGKETAKSRSITQASSTEYYTIESRDRDRAVHEYSVGDSRTNQESDIVSELGENIMPRMRSLTENCEIPFLDSSSTQGQRKNAHSLPIPSNGLTNEVESVRRERKDRNWKKSSLVKNLVSCNQVKRLMPHLEKNEENCDSANKDGTATLTHLDEINNVEEVNNDCHHKPQDVNQNTGNSLGLENGLIPNSSSVSNGNEKLNIVDKSCTIYLATCSEGDVEKNILKESTSDSKKEFQVPKREISWKIVRSTPRTQSKMLTPRGTVLKRSSNQRNSFYCEDFLKVAVINPHKNPSLKTQDTPTVTKNPTALLYEPSWRAHAICKKNKKLTHLTKRQRVVRDGKASKLETDECKKDYTTSPRKGGLERNYDSRSPPKPKMAPKRDGSQTVSQYAREKRNKRNIGLKESTCKAHSTQHIAEVPVLNDISSNNDTDTDSEVSSSNTRISSFRDIRQEIQLNSINADKQVSSDQECNPSKNSSHQTEDGMNASTLTNKIHTSSSSHDTLKCMDKCDENPEESSNWPGPVNKATLSLNFQPCHGELQSSECSGYSQEREQKSVHGKCSQTTRHSQGTCNQFDSSQELVDGGRKSRGRGSVSRNRGNETCSVKELKKDTYCSFRFNSRCRTVHDFKDMIRKLQHSQRSRISQRIGESFKGSLITPNDEQESKHNDNVHEFKFKTKALPTPSSQQHKRSRSEAKYSSGFRKCTEDRCKSIQETTECAITYTQRRKPRLHDAEEKDSSQQSRPAEESDTLFADKDITPTIEIVKSVSGPSIFDATACQRKTLEDEELNLTEQEQTTLKDFFDEHCTVGSSSKPRQEVIAGLGSVVDLLKNQDGYLSKLREVRRNFEMSIEALKESKEGGAAEICAETMDS